ncbi:hypothetical protein LCGC14_1764320 [marine sediment metagenome]|uniref:Uncharacterized protein n=1 Tax=marine sediment metagenome TaxID=412755 RepID=A0A0F9JZT6_9ZZZZ
MTTEKDLLLLILVGTLASTITIGILGVSLITIVPIVDMFGLVTIGTYTIYALHRRYSGWEYVDE